MLKKSERRLKTLQIGDGDLLDLAWPWEDSGEPQSIKLVLWHAAYLPLGLGVLHRISRVLDELLLPPDDLLAGVSCIRQRLGHQDTCACSGCSKLCYPSLA